MLFASHFWPSAELLTGLVRRAQRDEPNAIEELLAELRPGLVAFFQQRLTGDTAEDLTQLTLVRVSGAVWRIDPERADSYISTVARNLLRTSRKMNSRDRARQSEDDCAELPANGEGADDRLEYAELVRAIHRACMTTLPPGLREVGLRIVNGQDTATIAAELKISPITVRTRLMRVRAILRRELGPYIGDEAERRRRRA
jgi:RNA polymerase sigma factor (sigma-70 family)